MSEEGKIGKKRKTVLKQLMKEGIMKKWDFNCVIECKRHKSFLVARPQISLKNVATKLEGGGGGKALVASLSHDSFNTK